ncbi:MAG: TIGR01459 family HAD-type hydrolase [Sphingomicrobium sp.]
MSFWDTLDPRYRVILCDVWGVIHDGVDLYPNAAERLRQWREEGRTVILLTNAPRSAQSVATQLDRLRLPRDCWDHIATSGEAGIAALSALGQPVGFIGNPDDRRDLAERGVVFAEHDDFADLACTGVDGVRRDVGDYCDELERAAARGVTMHCLNPDKMVIRGGVAEPCAGALAERYEAIGGTVIWYGKPHSAIYDHAMRLAGNPPREMALAIGDALETDILGAARFGVDAVFVTGGIHRGNGFPKDFSASNGLGDWQPVAVVDGLA